MARVLLLGSVHWLWVLWLLTFVLPELPLARQFPVLLPARLPLIKRIQGQRIEWA